MANWWGNMTGAQAVEMGMNVFNMAQKQALLRQQQEAQTQQQAQENFFTRAQLDLKKQALDLQEAQNKFRNEQTQAELEQRKSEFGEELGFGKKKWAEELEFREKELVQRGALAKLKTTQAKPNLAEYPSAIKQAMDLYEQTGNWGIVQAVQEEYGIPVDKTPGKIRELKDAASVWEFAQKKGLPLKVDRKLGYGGTEMALPVEIVNKYGSKSLDALQKLTEGRMDGILGTDKYSQYSIPQIYELYFRVKKFIDGGRDTKEIVAKMKESKIPDDLINDIMKAL